MSAVVNMNQFQDIVKFLVKAKEQVSVPVYVHGAHGIGKTSIIRKIAQDIDYNCVVLNLANQTPEDLLGFPDGKGGYVNPGWLKVGSTKRTIYFLDEINRAPKYVLQCMFNFINEGRIHQMTIHPGDVVIAAGNPSDVDYETTDFEDKAFISRFAHFYLEPTQLEYIQYLESCKNEDGKIAIHPALLKTIRTSTEMLDKSSTKDQHRIHVEPDNRALEKIGRLMKILPKNQVTEIGYLIFAAMVGQDFAAVIIENWKTTSEIPSPEEIFTMDESDKYSFAPDQLDVITAINGNIAAFIENKIYKKNKIDYDISPNQLKNFHRYLAYIPRDSQVALISELNNRIGVSVIDFFEKMDKNYLDALLDIDKVLVEKNTKKK